MVFSSIEPLCAAPVFSDRTPFRNSYVRPPSIKPRLVSAGTGFTNVLTPDARIARSPAFSAPTLSRGRRARGARVPRRGHSSVAVERSTEFIPVAAHFPQGTLVRVVEMKALFFDGVCG
jgi:hypothetical protein